MCLDMWLCVKLLASCIAGRLSQTIVEFMGISKAQRNWLSHKSLELRAVSILYAPAVILQLRVSIYLTAPSILKNSSSIA